MRDTDEQVDGKRILFWSDLPTLKDKDGRPRISNPIFHALAVGVTSALASMGYVGRNPSDWILKTQIERAERELVGHALAHGKVLMRYMGAAECRICNRTLGTADLSGFGFIWPEKAEHYILDHDVWTPECNELLAAIYAHQRKTKR